MHHDMRRLMTLVEAQFRQPRIMFHGTCSAFLRSILKSGIVPDPKKKHWDSDEQQVQQAFSRASLDGSYWTSNLMTATSSASATRRKFGGDDLVVIAQIAEQSAYADEDSQMTDLRQAMGETVHALHPGIRTDFWMALGHDMYDAEPAAREQAQQIFMAKLHARLGGSAQHAPDRQLCDELLETLLLRDIAYETQSSWNGASSWVRNMPVVPSIAEIDAKLHSLRDRLTRSYRKTAFHSADNFNHTLRTMAPVGFSGANRILTIVEIPQWRWEGDTPGERKLMVDPLILRYGSAQLPADFLEQYRQRVGKFPGLVDAQGKLLMPDERTPAD